jgi:hypothetical protein
VLGKIGLSLTADDCKRLSSSNPGAIEALLLEFKNLAIENFKDKQNEERLLNENGAPKDREKD